MNTGDTDENKACISQRKHEMLWELQALWGELQAGATAEKVRETQNKSQKSDLAQNPHNGLFSVWEGRRKITSFVKTNGEVALFFKPELLGKTPQWPSEITTCPIRSPPFTHSYIWGLTCLPLLLLTVHHPCLFRPWSMPSTLSRTTLSLLHHAHSCLCTSQKLLLNLNLDYNHCCIFGQSLYMPSHVCNTHQLTIRESLIPFWIYLKSENWTT